MDYSRIPDSVPSGDFMPSSSVKYFWHSSCSIHSFKLNGLCMFVSVSKENLLRNALTVTSACKIVSRRQSKAEPESSTICTLCTVGAIQTVGNESLQSLKFYHHGEGPYTMSPG